MHDILTHTGLLDGSLVGAAVAATISNKNTALIVDDSKAVRKLIGRVLDKCGYQVSSATNGLEGLHLMQKYSFNIVFVDFLMPVMNGIQMVTRFRKWESENDLRLGKQYIVGISANADGTDIEEGKRMGMDHFCRKPLTVATMKAILDRVGLVQASSSLSNTGPRTSNASSQSPPPSTPTTSSSSSASR